MELLPPADSSVFYPRTGAVDLSDWRAWTELPESDGPQLRGWVYRQHSLAARVGTLSWESVQEASYETFCASAQALLELNQTNDIGYLWWD